MNTVIQEIFQQIESQDTESRKRTDLVVDLAMILETHTLESYDYNRRKSRNSCFLKEHLITLFLSKEEMIEIVNSMKNLVLGQDKLNGSLIWAIGKSMHDIGRDPLLEIINHESLTFDDFELYQLLLALGNILYWRGPFSLSDEEKQVINGSNLIIFLERIISPNSKANFSNETIEHTKAFLEHVKETLELEESVLEEKYRLEAQEFKPIPFLEELLASSLESDVPNQIIEAVRRLLEEAKNELELGESSSEQK